MPIYDFSSEPEPNNIIQPTPDALPGIDCPDKLDYKLYLKHEHQRIEQEASTAFYHLEATLIQYFSDIAIPGDGYVRYLSTKISGQKRSVAIWADDLVEGRTRLPVAAIARGAIVDDKDRFAPAYHHMHEQYVNQQRSLVKILYNPKNVKIDYTITIVTENKADMSYILAELLIRFNPIAEIFVDDGTYRGSSQLSIDAVTDISELEVGYDSEQLVKYEISFKATSWIKIPSMIVPAVAGVRPTYSIEQ